MNKLQIKRNVFHGLNILGWALTFMVFYFLDRAKPDTVNLFTAHIEEAIDDKWSEGLLRLAWMALIPALLLVTLGLLFNVLYARQAKKMISFSQLISVIVAYGFLLYFLIMF